ncbi:hypothetical protein [Ideonella sp.]|uniref:hypothetical protein n=1 Tax=Ideonella sp. TaxID=1929293 RepID=UPI0035B08861
MHRWTRPAEPATLALRPALAALALMAATASMAAPPPLYHIEVIDKGKSIRPMTGYSIANDGTIAGLGRDFEGTQAAFVRSNGKTRKLDTQGSRWGGAYGINNHGVTVGYNEFKATMWDANGVPTDINALILCDVYRSFAYSVNDAGAAVGTFSCYANTGWDGGSFIFHNGSLAKLPDFGNGNTVAVSINKFGQVVGSSEYPPDNGQRRMHAFSWHNGTMTDIGTLPGDVESEATAVNDLGQIIGRSNAPDGNAESFVYVNGTMYPLPRCAGNRVITEAINNKGQIVGSYQLKRYEAALIQDGRCYPLNALLDDSGKDWWELRAYDINDDGVIVGTGNFDNKWRGFVATPVKR